MAVVSAGRCRAAYIFAAAAIVVVVVQQFPVVLVDQLAVLPVARVLGYAVVVAVVNDAHLLEHVAPDGRLDGPVVAVGRLVVTVQTFNVHDFRIKPFQYDTDVLDG